MEQPCPPPHDQLPHNAVQNSPPASQRGPLPPYPYKKLKLPNPPITHPVSHELLLSPYYKVLERSPISGQIKARSRFLQSETRGG
ncbi:hypothetical protein DPMN_085346 [Dreissena polymorpha]|uniref:Uncharacterized protein n=1 Tax=Dreissena polymorpha TaxID=45954 RepID=A0A9D4BCS7_DREPO|nr:hypothetical protein DPMN_085346 [Dreissena polymorpha]